MFALIIIIGLATAARIPDSNDGYLRPDGTATNISYGYVNGINKSVQGINVSGGNGKKLNVYSGNKSTGGIQSGSERSSYDTSVGDVRIIQGGKRTSLNGSKSVFDSRYISQGREISLYDGASGPGVRRGPNGERSTNNDANRSIAVLEDKEGRNFVKKIRVSQQNTNNKTGDGQMVFIKDDDSVQSEEVRPELIDRRNMNKNVEIYRNENSARNYSMTTLEDFINKAQENQNNRKTVTNKNQRNKTILVNKVQNSRNKFTTDQPRYDVTTNLVIEDEDKWVWGGGEVTIREENARRTTPIPTNVTVDDRAAFSADKCPTGMVKFGGKCVDVD